MAKVGPIEIKDRSGAAFYKKLIIAHVIDTRANVNLRFLEEYLTWPRRTIQDNVRAMQNIGIILEYHGSAKQGYYSVKSWGLFDRDEVSGAILQMYEALDLFDNK